MNIEKSESQNFNIWQDANKIKQLFAPKLTPDEFNFFMSFL